MLGHPLYTLYTLCELVFFPRRGLPSGKHLGMPPFNKERDQPPVHYQHLWARRGGAAGRGSVLKKQVKQIEHCFFYTEVFRTLPLLNLLNQ